MNVEGPVVVSRKGQARIERGRAPGASRSCSWEEGRFSPAGFVHVPCTGAYFRTTDVVERLVRFSPGLTGADLQEIQAELLKPARTLGSTETE